MPTSSATSRSCRTARPSATSRRVRTGTASSAVSRRVTCRQRSRGTASVSRSTSSAIFVRRQCACSRSTTLKAGDCGGETASVGRPSSGFSPCGRTSDQRARNSPCTSRRTASSSAASSGSICSRVMTQYGQRQRDPWAQAAEQHGPSAQREREAEVHRVAAVAEDAGTHQRTRLRRAPIGLTVVWARRNCSVAEAIIAAPARPAATRRDSRGGCSSGRERRQSVQRPHQAPAQQRARGVAECAGAGSLRGCGLP